MLMIKCICFFYVREEEERDIYYINRAALYRLTTCETGGILVFRGC
jgi:hypothetical protein